MVLEKLKKTDSPKILEVYRQSQPFVEAIQTTTCSLIGVIKRLDIFRPQKYQSDIIWNATCGGGHNFIITNYPKHLRNVMLSFMNINKTRIDAINRNTCFTLINNQLFDFK